MCAIFCDPKFFLSLANNMLHKQNVKFLSRNFYFLERHWIISREIDQYLLRTKF